MPRLTQDQWETIRAEREAGSSFGDLAQRFNVSKSGIIKRAKAEGWSNGQDVAEIIRRKVSEKVSGIVTSDNPKRRAEAIDAAAGKVASVVERHQQEWTDHRDRFGSVPDDFENGKLAKISAEMLTIRQKGERAAYGLDEQGSKPEIVIERSFGL